MIRNLLLALTTGMAVAGCASLPAALTIRAPDVELDRVRITALSLAGGTLELDLGVTNPNAFRITTSRIEAEIGLEETHLGQIVLERGVALEPSTRQTVALPVTFTWAGIGAGARAVLERGSVGYDLVVRMTAGTPIGDRTFAIEQDGTVPIERMLR